ncbi:SUMF1/EgtB/PvdO family nonheme iron enzyme [Planctomycetota bacterium]
MPVSLKDFAKSLSDSGLISTEELQDFLGSFPSEKRPTSPKELARELIRAGKITKYQAEEVYRGRTKGLVLGNYVILDKIGAGGMGQVFKARHKVMERVVALKVLPPQAVKSAQSVQRFHREVKAAAKLEHPNIVTAHDADESGGIHFLVMQCVDGSDLSHIVSERGPLPVETAVDCIIQAARGLEYAHKQGVVHRDIKPANVLVDKEGTVKILDMGLARVFEEGEVAEDRLTDSGQVMGTCDYMAPEQAEDTHTADHRADIYSLGCTLYRLVTGNKPYEGGSPIQILMAHRAAPIPSLSEQRPDVPASLEAAYQKMMAKTPEDRYQSMTDVIAALEACVSKERQPVVSEASSDSALTAFLQNLSDGGVATRQKAAKVAEETVPSRADVETDKSIWRKIVPVDRRQRWIFAGIAAASALLIVLFGVVLSLRTPDGTLIVEIKEPDAIVKVLDEEGKVEIERKGGDGKLSISVDPGKHRLKVEKDGFQFFTESFEIASGEQVGIKATLKRLEEKAKVTSSFPKVEMPSTAFDPVEEVVESLEPVRTLGEATGDFGLAFSPDGLLLGHSTFPARLRNTNTWEWNSQLDGLNEAMTNLAFSSDGSLVALDQSADTLILWDLMKGEPRWSVATGGRSFFRSLDFSPDNSLLASLGRDCIAKLWDVATGELRQTIPIENVDDVVFSPSGSVLACGAGERLALWDATAGRLQSSFEDTEYDRGEQIRSISFSPDGSMLATANGAQDRVRIWDPMSGTVRQRLERKSARKSKVVAFSPDGSVLAVGYSDGTLTLWNPISGEELVTFLAHGDYVREVAFSPKAPLLASTGHDLTCKIWDVSKLVRPQAAVTTRETTDSRELLRTLEGHEDGVSSVAVAPDGSMLASGSGDSTVRLWDVATGALRKTIKEHSDGVSSVAFSPDGTLLASGSHDKTVILWDLTAGRVRRTLEGYAVAVSSVAFSPDGSLLATGCGAGDNPKLWDVATGEPRHGAMGPFFEKAGGLVAFSPDGSSLAVRGLNRVVDFLNLGTQEIRRFNFKVGDFVFSPDGSLMAASSTGEAVVNLWHLSTGQLKRTLNGHTRPVWSLAFSPDGSLLASGGRDQDNSIMLWDVAAAKPLTTLVGHKSGVRSLAFTPDSSVLVSGSGDKTVKIWDVSKLLPSKPKSNTPPLAIAPFNPEEAKQHQEAWAKHLGVPVVEKNSIGMQMVLIPPGEFLMGSTEEEIEELLKEGEEEGWLNRDLANRISSEGPQHTARISKPFRLAATEVTVGQFKEFVQSTEYETEAEKDGQGGRGFVEVAGVWTWEQKPDFNWRNPGAEQTDQHPVVNVSSNDAVAFCRWLSEQEGRPYLLPTEAQWEYACRSGSTTRWCFGNGEEDLGQYAWYGGDNDSKASSPVGEKLPNGFGMFDMHGNVWECCSDWYAEAYYNASPVADTEGPATGDRPVQRGGAFYHPPRLVRSAHRMSGEPTHRDGNIGFRPVLQIDPTDPKPTPKPPAEE